MSIEITNPSSGFTNPMTTVGDTIYENSTPAAARLAGNTNNTKKYLCQIGPTGAIANIQGQSTYFGNASGLGTESLAFTTAPLAGDLLFAVIGWETVTNLTITSVTDSQGNFWQPLPAQAGTPHSMQAWYALNCNAGATTVTVTWSAATATYIQISLAEYSGVDTLGPANSAAAGTSTTPTSNNITTTAAASLLIGYADDSSTTWTAGASYTLRTTSTSNRGAIEDQYSVGAGTYNASFTDVSGSAWECGIASFYHSAQTSVVAGWMSVTAADIDAAVPTAVILNNGSTGSGPIVLQTAPLLITPQTGSNVIEWRHVLDLNITTGAKTGTLKLILPTANRTAVNFLSIRVRGFDFATGAWVVQCGGQVHGGTGPWPVASATITAGIPPFTTVRFADDGTNACILLGVVGTSWSYPQFSMDVWAGYQSVVGWNTGWTTAFVTSEAGYTIYQSPATSSYIGAATGTVINATTGFQIGGAAATAGHYLRANATDYVDSAIQIGDLFSADGVTATKYLNETGAWTTPTFVAVPPSGTPIIEMIEYYNGSLDTNWANYSLWMKIPGSQILSNPASWIVRYAFNGGTGFHIAAANVMRVARTTGPGGNVVDVTVIKFGGATTLTGSLSSPSNTNFNVFSTDAINLQISADYDYWVLFYFDTDGGGLNAGVSIPRNTAAPPSLGTCPMGHTTGNQSITAGNAMTLTDALTTATQLFFWDVRAA